VLRALQRSGRDVVVVDDLSTGIAARVPENVPMIRASVLDTDALTAAMKDHHVTGVVHLAAKKAVGESMERPLWYYRENVDGILSVLTAMAEAGVRNIVYSSSAAVYGEPDQSPVTEDVPLQPISVYGETKVLGEWAVKSVAAVNDMSWLSLRYFNVAGAESAELGDTSVANLIPIVLEATSAGEPAKIFGADYPTPDGTCIRDYIHVVDLAEAHAAAAAAAEAGQVGASVNIGTGHGSSVIEVIDSVSRALGEPIVRSVIARRGGDPAELVATADRAQELLGWRAKHNLDDMVASAVAARKS